MCARRREDHARASGVCRAGRRLEEGRRSEAQVSRSWRCQVSAWCVDRGLQTLEAVCAEPCGPACLAATAVQAWSVVRAPGHPTTVLPTVTCERPAVGPHLTCRGPDQWDSSRVMGAEKSRPGPLVSVTRRGESGAAVFESEPGSKAPRKRWSASVRGAVCPWCLGGSSLRGWEAGRSLPTVPATPATQHPHLPHPGGWGVGQARPCAWGRARAGSLLWSGVWAPGKWLSHLCLLAPGSGQRVRGVPRGPWHRDGA